MEPFEFFHRIILDFKKNAINDDLSDWCQSEYYSMRCVNKSTDKNGRNEMCKTH